MKLTQLKEASYDQGRLPPRLKEKLINEVPTVCRHGIQHPTKLKTIPYDQWLYKNKNAIEDLYEQIEQELEIFDNNVSDIAMHLDVRDYISYPAYNEFIPRRADYRTEPSSKMMENKYMMQLIGITDVMYEYYLDQLGQEQLQEAKLALRRKQLSDFHVGDIILLVYRHHGIEKRIAEIRSVNHKGHGGHHENGITFKDAYHKDYLSSGQGWFDPTELGEHEYGMVDVEMFKRSTTPGWTRGAIREARYYQPSSSYAAFVHDALQELSPNDDPKCLDKDKEVLISKLDGALKQLEDAFGPSKKTYDDQNNYVDYQWKLGNYYVELFSYGIASEDVRYMGLCVSPDVQLWDDL